MSNYEQIRSTDISNGDGIGVSIFFSGCDFQCKNCFNKELWDYSYGHEFNEKTIKTIVELMDKPYITRLSILGGDPLMERNLNGVLDLVNEIRISCPKKSIWIYSGYTINEIFPIGIEDDAKIIENIIKRQQIIKQCDVMVDGRYIDSQRDISLKWRGSSNQRVINIQETLRRNKLVLYCE